MYRLHLSVLLSTLFFLIIILFSSIFKFNASNRRRNSLICRMCIQDIRHGKGENTKNTLNTWYYKNLAIFNLQACDALKLCAEIWRGVRWSWTSMTTWYDWWLRGLSANGYGYCISLMSTMDGVAARDENRVFEWCCVSLYCGCLRKFAVYMFEKIYLALHCV